MKKLIIVIAALTLGTGLMAEAITGRGKGYNGEIVVEVHKDGNVITSIYVIEHFDTPKIAKKAFSNITKSILEAQSTDVDIIAGATYSSRGFIDAIEEALCK